MVLDPDAYLVIPRGRPTRAASLYDPGSRWSYRTRPGEEDSSAIVLLETDLVEYVVHVQVRGVLLESSGMPAVASDILYLPMTPRAVRESFRGQIDRVEPDEGWREGHALWLTRLPDVLVWAMPIATILNCLAVLPRDCESFPLCRRARRPTMNLKALFLGTTTDAAAAPLPADNMLRVYAIYGPTTRDYPGLYVVRPFRIEAGRSVPEELIIRARTLQEARDQLHEQVPGADRRIPHQPGEDPVIVETWI